MDYLRKLGMKTYLSELSFPDIQKQHTSRFEDGEELITERWEATFPDEEAAIAVVCEMDTLPEWVQEQWLAQSSVNRVAIRTTRRPIPNPVILDEKGIIPKDPNAQLHCTAVRKENVRQEILYRAMQDTYNTPIGAPRQKFSQRASFPTRHGSTACPLHEVKPRSQPRGTHSEAHRKRKSSSDRTTAGSENPTASCGIPRMDVDLISVQVSSAR